METEVATPIPTSEFNFDSSCSSPYITAPSSPQRFGNFVFSAPTSPTRALTFFQEFNDLSLISQPHEAHRKSDSLIPFKWEEKPEISKNRASQNRENTYGNENDDQDYNFEFNFSGKLDKTSLSAEELFDGGKIKPLKPPPRSQLGKNNIEANDSRKGQSIKSPRSPRSSSKIFQGKKIVEEVLISPKSKKKYFDSLEVAIEETRKKGELDEQYYKQENRGRERSSSSSIRKGTRSLSPLRVSDIMFDKDPDEINSSQTTSSKIGQNQNSKPETSSSTSYSSILSAISFSKGYRKWNLKDLLLFRSASEGRATSKDPLRKYAVLSKKVADDDVKNLSFRSTESSGSVSSRRRGPVSAHELHYTMNRAVSEEMKKKTFLPYKQGLLGCLGFNPGVHEISRSFGSFTRG